MKVIIESEMEFGEFDEENLFLIEKSSIYKDLGDGIKTVEFVLRYGTKKILFLEAKKTCPNVENKGNTKEKSEKYEEYYSQITEKFIESIQLYIASILGRYENISEIGEALQNIKSLQKVDLVCVLVIKNAKETWLAGPMAELNFRLRKMRKIWGVEVKVLNEALAKNYKLIR